MDTQQKYNIEKIKQQIQFIEKNKKKGKTFLESNCEFLFQRYPAIFEMVTTHEETFYKTILNKMLMGITCLENDKCTEKEMSEMIGYTLTEEFLDIPQNETKYHSLLQKSKEKFRDITHI